jgi:hypothetical protein
MRQHTTCPSRHQQGQSMTEFLVALTVLLPLFLAIGYAGKYSDIQQTATQASRYAAMQRAMEPNSARLSNSVIEDQTRARFFIDASQVHAGHLQSDDSSAPIKKDDKQRALWRDQKYGALLSSLDQVKVNMVSAPMGDKGALTLANAFVGKTNTLPSVAQVEVTLVNKMNLVDAKPADLKIAAATAAVGNDWSTQGNAQTIKTINPLVPAHYLKPVEFIVDAFTFIFEGGGHNFELGCIKPDVVASHRLKGASSTEACP